MIVRLNGLVYVNQFEHDLIFHCHLVRFFFSPHNFQYGNVCIWRKLVYRFCWREKEKYSPCTSLCNNTLRRRPRSNGIPQEFSEHLFSQMAFLFLLRLTVDWLPTLVIPAFKKLSFWLVRWTLTHLRYKAMMRRLNQMCRCKEKRVLYFSCSIQRLLHAH